MTAQLDQVVPSAASALVDRYGKITTAWYPWFLKIIEFVNGIARGELIVDGAITTRTLAAGAVTADVIASNVFLGIYAQVETIVTDELDALVITTDMLDAVNVQVLNGTFGTMQTNLTNTRIQITDATNELRCYINGALVASVGADVITRGAFVKVDSPSSVWYPFVATNTSTTGGDLGTGGGCMVATSRGGYCIQAGTTTTASAISVIGRNIGSGGGRGDLGRSSALGGWAVYAAAGSYGPFTGAHDALVSKSDTFEPGDIVVDGGVRGRRLSDCMTDVRLSTEPNQKGAWGAFVKRYPLMDEPPPSMVDQDWYGWGLTHDLAVVNGVGEGCINVCGLGGDIEAGDLIVTSAMPGKGMRQADDILRACTVATAREAVRFSCETDVKQIACFYLRG